jgi:hypothetical protein
VKYLVSELIVFFAALAALFSLGTFFVILFIFIQECARWSIRKLRLHKGQLLSLRVESDLPPNR